MLNKFKKIFYDRERTQFFSSLFYFFLYFFPLSSFCFSLHLNNLLLHFPSNTEYHSSPCVSPKIFLQIPVYKEIEYARILIFSVMVFPLSYIINYQQLT